jgi:hypothetical protein
VYDIYIWIRFDSSFSGYWTDRIIFWLWFITAIIIIFTSWSKDLYSKIYLYSIIGLIILSMIPMMIPFISIVSMVFGADRDFSIKLTPTLRLDEVAKGPMSLPGVLVIEKRGLLEQEIASLEYYDWGVELDGNQYRLRELDDVKLISMNPDTIALEFRKNGKSVIYKQTRKNNRLSPTTE